VTLALILVAVGGVLVYAAITGKSVTRLLVGDNQTPSTNRALPAD